MIAYMGNKNGVEQDFVPHRLIAVFCLLFHYYVIS